MSSGVTITTTTRTTSSSGFACNIGYCKSIPGILKVAQVILGTICVGISGHYVGSYQYPTNVGQLYFFLMSVTFLIGTFILLLSCLVSFGTSGLISQTIYELLYHSIAFILYFAAGLVVVIEINEDTLINILVKEMYDPFMAASIIGLFLSLLYLVSALFSYKSYRGI